MAYYYGYVTVDVSSYDAFRNDVYGNGYDCDGLYGAQCLDAFMLLNFNIGGVSAGYYDGPPYVKAGPNESAYETWTVLASRIYNAADNYDLIYNLTDVKRGDMIIFSGPYSPGHNALADEDYNPLHPSYIAVLGQNQNGSYFPGGGACFNVINFQTSLFLGAFRLKSWNQGPTPVQVKHKFPWYLIANKLRNQNLYSNI